MTRGERAQPLGRTRERLFFRRFLALVDLVSEERQLLGAAFDLGLGLSAPLRASQPGQLVCVYQSTKTQAPMLTKVMANSAVTQPRIARSPIAINSPGMIATPLR
jgi:hypothetical protein